MSCEEFHQYRHAPIPDLSDLCEAIEYYYTHPLYTHDEKSSESLVELHTYGIAGHNYYHHPWNPPYFDSIPGSIPDLLARVTVAEKLVAINQKLENFGLEVYVFDAYRPLAVQNFFYFEWFPNFLRRHFPEKDEVWIMNHLDLYWAKGIRTRQELFHRIPPHSTGAAIDLTLRHKETGILLEMGSLFDDCSSVAHLDMLESPGSQEEMEFTRAEARSNRRLLYHIMTGEEFACNPYEWWHYSYGDQIWALFTQQEYAFFDYAGHMVGERLEGEKIV